MVGVLFGREGRVFSLFGDTRPIVDSLLDAFLSTLSSTTVSHLFFFFLIIILIYSRFHSFLQLVISRDLSLLVQSIEDILELFPLPLIGIESTPIMQE